MKILINLLALFIAIAINTRDISGETNYISLWEGKIILGNGEDPKVVFKFFKTGNDSIGAFIDSPDQGAKDIPTNKVIYGDDSVYVQIKAIQGFYAGKFNSDKTKIEGKWNQRGASFVLNLDRTDKVEEVKHPQEPKRPFPYNEEDVTFENKEAGITLAGTFTYPKDGSSFPAVVLVTGSGPQNRDEAVLGHKPFLVWSDYFTRNGIAVLRFDDRGVGKSTGNFGAATTKDLAGDAVAAVNYLKTRKEVNAKKIGMAGHSEGGVIAPIAANRTKDIAFIVLAGGTAVPGDEALLLQLELISRLGGVSEERIKKDIEINKSTFEIIKNTQDSTETAKKINKLNDDCYAGLSDAEKSLPENSKGSFELRKRNSMSMWRWMKYFLSYDPRTELSKLKIPVLAVFGEKDVQVIPSQHKGEMEKALRKSKSKNYKVVVLPGLNHVFQECNTGSPQEYPKIEQTTSPKMLELMTGWISEVGK